MIDLTGRVVLITGAAGGIGAATARTVVAAGGRVVLHELRDRRAAWRSSPPSSATARSS